MECSSTRCSEEQGDVHSSEPTTAPSLCVKTLLHRKLGQLDPIEALFAQFSTLLRNAANNGKIVVAGERLIARLSESASQQLTSILCKPL